MSVLIGTALLVVGYECLYGGAGKGILPWRRNEDKNELEEVKEEDQKAATKAQRMARWGMRSAESAVQDAQDIYNKQKTKRTRPKGRLTRTRWSRRSSQDAGEDEDYE